MLKTGDSNRRGEASIQRERDEKGKEDRVKFVKEERRKSQQWGGGGCMKVFLLVRNTSCLASAVVAAVVAAGGVSRSEMLSFMAPVG